MSREFPDRPTLGDFIELKRGYDLPLSQRRPGRFPIVSSSGITGCHDEPKAVAPGVVTGRYGTLGQTFYLEQDFWPLNTTLYVRDFKRNCPRFVAYYLKTVDFSDFSDKSSVPGVNRNHLHASPADFPSLADQEAIAEVLGALDDKIAANRRLAGAARGVAAAAVERALAQTQAASRSVDELAEFLNRRRIPLSKNERAERPGDIPYFGATGVVDYVDEPIFDEPLVLVGEDGTVLTDSGGPIVQYVSGPSWVNNHAHVLKGVAVSTELLRYLVARVNVADRVTGAVQLKISMGNLRSVQLPVPHEQVIGELEDLVAGFTSREVAAERESQRVAATRDELLPLLMSGRITVKDAERRVENEV